MLPAALTAVFVPGLAFACSGHGAAELIRRNELVGWLLFGATIVVATAFGLAPRVRARGWRGMGPLVALILVHPAYWMSARHGDCGRMLLASAIIVTALAPIVGGIVYWWAGRTPSPSLPRP